MAVVNVLLTRAFDHAEIAEPFDLLMLAEIVADLGRILARALHAQFHGLQGPQQHPGRVGIADAAHRVAQAAHRIHPLLSAGDRACHEVRMAADIFGQRIDHDVRAMI